jgi:hypothetical protein
VIQAVRVFYILSNKNIGQQYIGGYNIGVKSIEGVKWFWRKYIEEGKAGEG